MTDTTPVPLKVIAVNPPSLDDVDENGRYMVTLKLSRQVTAAEYHGVPAIARGMRAYASTLEIARTTLETVAETTRDIASLLATVEARGRKEDEHAALVARREEEAEHARTVEEERLRKFAEGIKFD
ncbi:hypothetical protein A2J03_09815 [Rhodococcus sp. EPR-157]|uniref:hypothetical protein n=1 Tax=Rhodococcus sp. EPR-157 TaxID=1813677 RepID=UPI0007BAFE60|nr:hypothetical protein [Rhodococcus sp. EPR-157]KZF00872.1 hypothetical protein A2J03_09815 [Rhodococcus sp. EPR-157]